MTSTANFVIREAEHKDFDAIWPFFHDITASGDTYAYPSNLSQEGGRERWMEKPRQTFVLEAGGEILGSYYIKTNAEGPGAHVCNCGYMVSSRARGRGMASSLCRHSMDVARDLGYLAMQFNFVASSNTGAIRLWERMGFQTIGRLPGAFKHPTLGYIDALVMYQWLGPDPLPESASER